MPENTSKEVKPKDALTSDAYRSDKQTHIGRMRLGEMSMVMHAASVNAESKTQNVQAIYTKNAVIRQGHKTTSVVHAARQYVRR